jgi:hypothetical protein
MTQLFAFAAGADSLLVTGLAAAVAAPFDGVADDWAAPKAGVNRTTLNATPEARDKGPRYFLIGATSCSSSLELFLAVLAVE